MNMHDNNRYNTQATPIPNQRPMHAQQPHHGFQHQGQFHQPQMIDGRAYCAPIYNEAIGQAKNALAQFGVPHHMLGIVDNVIEAFHNHIVDISNTPYSNGTINVGRISELVQNGIVPHCLELINGAPPQQQQPVPQFGHMNRGTGFRNNSMGPGFGGTNPQPTSLFNDTSVQQQQQRPAEPVNNTQQQTHTTQRVNSVPENNISLNDPTIKGTVWHIKDINGIFETDGSGLTWQIRNKHVYTLNTTVKKAFGSEKDIASILIHKLEDQIAGREFIITAKGQLLKAVKMNNNYQVEIKRCFDKITQILNMDDMFGVNAINDIISQVKKLSVEPQQYVTDLILRSVEKHISLKMFTQQDSISLTLSDIALTDLYSVPAIEKLCVSAEMNHEVIINHLIKSALKSIFFEEAIITSPTNSDILKSKNITTVIEDTTVYDLANHNLPSSKATLLINTVKENYLFHTVKCDMCITNLKLPYVKGSNLYPYLTDIPSFLFSAYAQNILTTKDVDLSVVADFTKSMDALSQIHNVLCVNDKNEVSESDISFGLGITALLKVIKY